jgi:hypothetical protein
MLVAEDAINRLNAIARLQTENHEPVVIAGVSRFDANAGVWRTTAYLDTELPKRGFHLSFTLTQST